MKTWAKGVYMGQEFAVNNIVRYNEGESRFAIHEGQPIPKIEIPDKLGRYLIRYWHMEYQYYAVLAGKHRVGR